MRGFLIRRWTLDVSPFFSLANLSGLPKFEALCAPIL